MRICLPSAVALAGTQTFLETRVLGNSGRQDGTRADAHRVGAGSVEDLGTVPEPSATRVSAVRLAIRQARRRITGFQSNHTPDNLLRLDVPKLDAIAPIIWARWGSTFLEVLREDSLDAADGLAFRAMNSDGGVRTLLIVCTANRARIQTLEQALPLNVVARPADWENYSVAEMIFKTEKGSGLGHQELRDGNGRTALVLCATRPASVRTLEKLCDLPG